jgi:hypothetical protein
LEDDVPDRFQTTHSLERLAFLSDRVLKIADIDPALTGSERVSLIRAAQLIAVVREGAPIGPTLAASEIGSGHSLTT